MAITPEQARAELERRRAASTTPTITPEQAQAELAKRRAKAFVERTNPVPEKKPGLFQSVVQGVAKLPLKVASSVAPAAEAAYAAVSPSFGMKDIERRNKEGRDFGYFGQNVRPFGSALQDASGGKAPVYKAGINYAKEVGGSALEAASYLVPVGKAPALLNATRTGRVISGIGQGVKAGVASGALGAGGSELAKADSTLGSVAGQTIAGGALGGVGGGALGAAGPLLANLSPTVRADKSFNSIAAQRLKGIQDLESKNSVVKRIFLDADKRGVDVRKVLSETDLLNGAVSTDGRINAQTALQNFDEVLAPYEGKVREALTAENRLVSVEDISKAVDDFLKQSRLLGEANTQVENALYADIARIAKGSNRIPLTTIHDLKVQRASANNYLNPEANAVNKEVARLYKELVERNTTAIDAPKYNAELSRLYTVRDAIEALDNKVVRGGRGGKYFAQTVGAIAGSKLGPVGSIAGAEIGGSVQGQLLKRALGGDQVGQFKVPNALLSAMKPTATGKMAVPPVKLPAKTGGVPTLNLQSNQLGSRTANQTTAIPTNRNVIPVSESLATVPRPTPNSSPLPTPKQVNNAKIKETFGELPTRFTAETKSNIVQIIDDYRLNKGANLELQQDAARIAEDFGLPKTTRYGDLVRMLERKLQEQDSYVTK